MLTMRMAQAGLFAALVLALGLLARDGVPTYAWTAPVALNTNAATDSGSDGAHPITTDGAGNWVAVWTSEDDLGGTIGTDRDILVARSTDNGATWTAPAALNTNAATDSGSDWEAQVTTDGGGNWVAVWTSNDPLGYTIGGDWDILVARSTDNGATWTAPAALNTNAATDSGTDRCPQLTTDGAGNWVAVWWSSADLAGGTQADYDILLSLSTDNGATWSSPAFLNTNAATDSGNDEEPQVTTDGAGNWVAAWFSDEDLDGTIGTDWDILVARSTDNGATWTAPVPLNTNAPSDSGGDYRPQVTTDGAGNWVAVWDSTEDLGGTIGNEVDILVARSTDHGATWSAPAALNTNAATDSGTDYYPQVTTDGAGHWVAVWYSFDSLGGTIGTDADILVSRSTNNGAIWTAPAALNTNAATDLGDDVVPQVTTDGLGNWVAVWSSDDDLGGTIGTDDDILVARWRHPSIDPAPLNTNAPTDTGDDEDPQVTTDGAGNWVAVWQSDENLGGTIGTDPDILVARSTDNGATWTAPAALNSSAATDSGDDWNPQVTTDGGGNWVAVWESSENLGGTIGTDFDILVARSTDNGATWTAPAALNTNAAADSGSDVGAQVTTDGGGNWVVAWSSNENLGGTIGTDTDILVARSIDNGATWTPPVALNTNAAADSGFDWDPQVTTDGGGNWVAVWGSADDLGGTIETDPDILVARSTDNGATWTAPAALSTNAATDSAGDGGPEVTTDGGGNWVAVWYSNEDLGGPIGIDPDILVARSTDNGATWTAPAALNTTAAIDWESDAWPQVTTDGGANWVALWESSHNLGGAIGTDNDILESRSKDNGATWTAPAALNTNAATDSGWDESAQVTTDGGGNWVTVWGSDDDLGGTIGTDDDILVALPAWFPPYPPADTDEVERLYLRFSDIVLDLDLDGTPETPVGPVTFWGEGEIDRSDPYLSGGLWTVDTEMTSGELQALVNGNPVTISVVPPSTGRIQELAPGTGFPADSYFDVFFEVNSPTFGLLENCNGVEVTFDAEIDSIQPIGAVYDVAGDELQACDEGGGLLRMTGVGPLSPGIHRVTGDDPQAFGLGAVGGTAEYPEVAAGAGAAVDTRSGSGFNYVALGAALGAASAALAAGAWYARRRWLT